MAVPQLKKIFCVIDPTTNNQRGLNRAASVARNSGAEIHAHVCFSVPSGVRANDKDSLREAEQSRHEAWVERLVAPLQSEGLKISTEVECDEDWRSALIAAAKRSEADLIVRSSFRRSALQRRVLKTTDWALLREAHCPVLLVKTERIGKLEKVLVALDIKDKDETHKTLTDQVIAHARSVAERSGAELHAVNAYQGAMSFVHPPDLAKRVGIERSMAHVGDGSPEAIIAKEAEKLGSPLVVIGSLARKGVSGIVVGNTAERILDDINADVMVVLQR
jgi:universal stress protein E